MADQEEGAGEREPLERSEELGEEADGLEREGSQLDDKVKETGSDWESKKDDEEVPGAQRPSEELDEPQEEQTAEPEPDEDDGDDADEDEGKSGAAGAGYEETGDDDSG